MFRMRIPSFTIMGAAVVLLVQSAPGQQPAAKPMATNSLITIPKVVIIQTATNTTVVTTNAPAVFPPDPEQLTVDLGGGVKMEFVLIHPGTFPMGSVENSPPVHNVSITKPFYMGKYEVTQDQWLVVMRENRSKFNDPQRPVEHVSWEDCQKFLLTLNATAAGRRFCLPTEAQWEYACRAGSTNENWFGNDDADLGLYGWYMKNATRMTHPVGELKPNGWGLYDMQGNVWEWCADWYGSFEGADAIDPVGPMTGTVRVLRGGSWFNYAPSCRCTNRGFYEPQTRNAYCGFRVVVEVH